MTSVSASETRWPAAGLAERPRPPAPKSPPAGAGSPEETIAMSEVSDALKRKMDLVLEENCRELPDGGDHETRKMVAARLLDAALAGHSTFGELGIVARKAIAEITGD
jgi:hypothetical protein